MKVDTAKIPGFDGMNADEKLEAVLGFEFETPAPAVDNSEIERLKSAVTKANSEAADFKKQLRAKQSEDEIKAAQAEEEKKQAAEERESLLKQLEELTKEKTIKQYETAYLGLGYDADLAKQNAEALQAGNLDVVFANQKTFIESQKKAAMSAAIDSQPGISTGNPLGKGNLGDPFMAQVRKFAGLPTK